MASFTREITANSAFGRQLLEAGARKAEAMLREVGEDAVRRVDQILRKEFNTNRPESRRNPATAGEGRLLGSFSYRISNPGGGAPITLKLISSASEVKVNSLNYGSVPHGIDGTKPDGLLKFPPSGIGSNAPAFAKGKGRITYRTQAGTAFSTPRGGGGSAYIRVPHVDHPGMQSGARFMNRALSSAVRAKFPNAPDLS
jgi:hypothetical protein